MKCDKCGEEKDSVMRRNLDAELADADGKPYRAVNPLLCRECCATERGRAWMKEAVNG